MIGHGVLWVFAGVFALTSCAPAPRAGDRLPEGVQRRQIGGEGVSGTTLSYLRAGPHGAPRLIFIHGTPGDATHYLDYLTDPPEGFEVISVDRPGFGHSGRRDPESLTFTGQAAAVAPLLVERDGRWPVIVGHSLGGPIACRLAAELPEQVGGLVVLAGSVDPDLEMPRWYNVLGAVPPVPWLLPRSLARSNQEIFAAPRQTRLLAEVLDQIRCPVAIVQGQDDELVPSANASFLQAHLPQAERVYLYLLPQAGHFLPWEQAQTVRTAIQAVVQGQGSPAPVADSH